MYQQRVSIHISEYFLELALPVGGWAVETWAVDLGKNASLVPSFILVLVHCKNNLRVCGIMEDIQMFKMEFLDSY